MANSSTDNISSDRISSLEGVRTIAFFTILLSHTSKIIPGRWGVSVFFILSGFVLFIAYDKRDVSTNVIEALTFALNKMKKLYPLHIIMLVVGLIWSLVFFDPQIKELIWKIPICTFLLQSWTPHTYHALNSVAWYLSTTLFLYFLFPFIRCIIKRIEKGAFRIFMIILLSAAVMATIMYVSTYIKELDSRWFLYCFPPLRILDLIVGCCMGGIFLKIKDVHTLRTTTATALEVLIAIISIISIIVFMKLPQDIQTAWYSWTLMFIPVNACLIFIFSFNRGYLSKLFSHRILLFLARITPFAFLIHIHVMHFAQQALSNIADKKTMYIIILSIITAVVSVLLSLLYEKIQTHMILAKRDNNSKIIL